MTGDAKRNIGCLVGVALLAAGFWFMWKPLAFLFIGAFVCFLVVSSAIEADKRKRSAP
jgi:hypothetical protein